MRHQEGPGRQSMSRNTEEMGNTGDKATGSGMRWIRGRLKALEDSRGYGRPRKPVEGVADAEDPETVEGVEGADDPEWQWQARGSRGLC